MESPHKPFKLRLVVFHGNGLQPGIDPTLPRWLAYDELAPDDVVPPSAEPAARLTRPNGCFPTRFGVRSRVMFKILGLLLNAAGVAALWFGGVPYKEKQTVLDVGPLKAEATIEKKLEIPPPVGAGLVGAGSVLLLIPTGRRKKD